MIKSGITKIDDFLNGGFTGGFITDIFGSPASGKSQIVFQICANAIMNNSSVLFQDTKGEFRPERILEILKANNKDEKLLENIKVLRITNTSEQISNLSKIESNFSCIETNSDTWVGSEISTPSSAQTKFVTVASNIAKMIFMLLCFLSMMIKFALLNKNRFQSDFP